MISGVVIPELRLKPKSRPVSGEVTLDPLSPSQQPREDPLQERLQHQEPVQEVSCIKTNTAGQEAQPSKPTGNERTDENPGGVFAQKQQQSSLHRQHQQRPDNNISMEDEPEMLQQSRLVNNNPAVTTNSVAQPAEEEEEMMQTLTQSRVSELTNSSKISDLGLTSSQIAREAGDVAARFDLSQVNHKLISNYCSQFSGCFACMYVCVARVCFCAFEAKLFIMWSGS